jgi:hypothetical protein
MAASAAAGGHAKRAALLSVALVALDGGPLACTTIGNTRPDLVGVMLHLPPGAVVDTGRLAAHAVRAGSLG